MPAFTKHLTFMVVYITNHNRILYGRNYYPHFQLKKLELRDAMWPAKGHTGSSVSYLVFLSSALSLPDHAAPDWALENPSSTSFNGSLMCIG